MSLEAWGDDGDADRPYTQERVDEIIAEECADLAMMVRRLARALKNVGSATTLADEALDLLERKGLSGNPLRGPSTRQFACQTCQDTGEIEVMTSHLGPDDYTETIACPDCGFPKDQGHGVPSA